MTIVLPNDPNGAVIVKSEDVHKWHKLFAEAEKKIKEIEHSNEGLDIPAINELRYVAFHLLETLNATPAEQESHKPRIIAHLQRSIYDACEALISIQLTELKKFQEDYRLAVVSGVIQNYQELMEKAEEASSLIKGTQRGHDGREAYYAEALKHVEVLNKINITLRAGRDELNKALAIQRRDSRRWVIGLAAAVLAAIAGLITKLMP